MPLRTVSAGTLDFIDDGLHYGDATLAAIERTIAGR